MNISYDSYRVFYFAARYKSFSKAAAALYNNQPNITRIIRRLEAELHCALFFRTPQGVRLTPEGERLYARVSVAYDSIEAAEAELLSDQSLNSGAVHISTSDLGLHSTLLRVLEQYRRDYPNVHIYLTHHSTPQGLAAVQNGLADFAVISEGANTPDCLTAQKVGTVQELAVCGPAFAELTQEPQTLRHLAEYPLISLARGTSSYELYSDFFRSHGLEYKPSVEVETVDQVRSAVYSNLGVGFVPQEMLYGPLGAPYICGIRLREQLPVRSIHLLQRKYQPLSPAAQKLRRMLIAAQAE